MGFLAGLPLTCPPPWMLLLPLYPMPHTHSSSLFLSPSLQIRAAGVYCYLIQAGAAMGGPALPGYLVNGALLWAGDTSWSSPIFLIECFNTSYRETAVLQISTLCDIDKCAAWTLQKPNSSQALCSSLPSQHRHLNLPPHTHTHTHTQTHTPYELGWRGRITEVLCLIPTVNHLPVHWLTVAKAQMQSVVQHNIYCWETAVKRQVTKYELNSTSHADWFKSVVTTNLRSVFFVIFGYFRACGHPFLESQNTNWDSRHQASLFFTWLMGKLGLLDIHTENCTAALAEVCCFK